MYPQKKQVNSTMSPNKLSEDGPKKIKLKLKEQASEPFWSTYSKTMSKKLLFPIETDGVDSDLIFSNGSFTNMEHSSFLYQIKNPDLQIKNLLKIYYPLSLSTQPNITEAENIKYSRKIRIYPSSEQKSFFQK